MEWFIFTFLFFFFFFFFFIYSFLATIFFKFSTTIIFKSPKVIIFGNILIWNLSNLYNFEWNYSVIFSYKIHWFFLPSFIFLGYDYYSLTYHYPYLVFLLKNLSNFNLRDYYYLLENISDHNPIITPLGIFPQLAPPLNRRAPSILLASNAKQHLFVLLFLATATLIRTCQLWVSIEILGFGLYLCLWLLGLKRLSVPTNKRLGH